MWGFSFSKKIPTFVANRYKMNNDFFEYEFESTIDKTKLPSNIATIDDDSNTGNVYTKKEVEHILNEDLETKADKTDLNAKANADASQLTPENIAQWKEKLGVGELPSNIATIDEGDKQGNTYTKEKVNELLENSGKNLANADLQIPAGTVRTLNVTRAKFGIQGLENKSSDKAFNSRVVMNKFGHIAINDNPEIITNFTVPDRINLNVTENFANVTFNKKPNYSQDIIDALNFIKTINDKDYTKFRVSEMIPYHIADEDLPAEIAKDSQRKSILQNYITVPTDGVITVNGDRGVDIRSKLYVQDYITAMSVKERKAVVNVVFNKEFPEDKDWIITFYTDLPYHLPYRSSGALFGFRESKVEKCDCDLTKSIFKTSDGGRGDTKIIFKDYYYYNKIVFQADNVRFWAIKKGSTLTIMLQSLESGQIAIDIRPYKSEYKFLHFYKALDADKNDTINGYYYNFKNLSYWIAN